MKEYIEREALMFNIAAKFEKHYGKSREQSIHDFYKFVIKKICAVPAADVVEVVRCKDCKYCIPATADGAEYELCIVDDDVFPVSVQKQHFCSRGKRKEE